MTNSAGRFRVPIVGSVVALGLLLTACSQKHPVSSAVLSHQRGTPSGVAAPTDTRVSAVRWAGPGQLYVFTWGGDCGGTPLPTHVTAGGAHRLFLVIAMTGKSSGGACADVLTDFTSVVEEPVGLDDTQSVAVQIDGVGATTATLPPRS